MDDQKTINTLKGLVIDGVNKAKSGHPGGALSSMDFAYLLFSEYLNFDPSNPKWQGRDRFVLSAGHESMLLYSLLYANGWLEIEDLKQFRQLHSKTPGHPENFQTPGVECTTGPLGQGAAMSVGFAIGAKHLGARLKTELFENKVYALLGDGCMQEGITLGAASYAGHLKLGNLIWYYDKNKIQISGETSRSCSDDEEKIFEGFGWKVLKVNGHDHGQLRSALDQAQNLSQPLLIIGDSIMAHGTFSLEGSAKTHGSPLPADERAATKKKLGLPDQDFYASDDSINHYRRNFAKKSSRVKEWQESLDKELKNNPDFKQLYDKIYASISVDELSSIDWPTDKAIATRNAFGEIIEKWADELPQLVGGSADLEPSNMTGAFAKKVGDFQGESPKGRNFAFGVREFPMSAICNGIALNGGLVPFDATFLSFADYSRAALRLGAIQKAQVIHEFSHDSFYLGEDGPTHQAVEQVMSLRLIPDFFVMRPADAIETEVMMRESLNLTENPSAICLSRQGLPLLPIERKAYDNAKRGAYVVSDVKDPEYVIFATGSEVSLALETAELLGKDKVKIISVPCWELFDLQDKPYQQSILSSDISRRISIEAGSTSGWQKFTGSDGLNIGIDHYGDSAPANQLAEAYGFTPKAIAGRINEFFSGVEN